MRNLYSSEHQKEFSALDQRRPTSCPSSEFNKMTHSRSRMYINTGGMVENDVFTRESLSNDN